MNNGALSCIPLKSLSRVTGYLINGKVLLLVRLVINGSFIHIQCDCLQEAFNVP